MNLPNRLSFWAGMAVFCLTFAVFSGSLRHDFVNWDDPFYVVENAEIKGLNADHLDRMFGTFQYGFYAPLSQVSLAVDHALWGLNPTGYHLTNLLLHALNAVLVFFLAKSLIRMAMPSKETLSAAALTGGAVAAALLFGIHPLRVESVAWVSERRDVLSGFLALACVLAYVQYGATRNGRWWVASFGLFVLAILAKPVAVMLTAVLLLLDVHPLGRVNLLARPIPWRGMAVILAEKIPFAAVSLFIGLGTIYGVGCGYLENRAYSLEELGWGARTAQSFAANLHYLNKLLAPVGLSPLYPLATYNFHQPLVGLGVLVAAVATGLGILWFRRWPALLVSWGAYLVLIAPFLGMAASGPQFAADRYTYLPSIAVCVALGGWFARGFQTRRMGSAAIVGGLTLALGSLSIAQTRIWENSTTLWTHAVKENPFNAAAWVYLAESLDQDGRREEALSCMRIVTRRFPRYAEGWFELGCLLGSTRRHEEALDAYRRCIELSPRYHQAHQNMGWIYCGQGRWREALRSLQTAQDLKPTPAMLFGIGLCHEKLGNREAAIRHYRLAVTAGFPGAQAELDRLTAPRAKIR